MADEGEKHPGGRPPYEPNDKDRRAVESMARFVSHDEIALVLGISDETVRKYYRHELDTAKIKADTAVGQSLILQAIGGPDQNWREAIPAATIFYAKTRIKGFKESIDHNLSGAVGRYDLTKLPDDQLTSLIEILTTIAPSPNPGGGDGGEGSPQG